MAKFAANLSMLFTEVDFLERFDAAAQAGFSGVEYLFPYAFDAEQIKQKLEQNNLTQVLFNLPRVIGMLATAALRVTRHASKSFSQVLR